MAKMRADSEKNLKNEENQEKQVSFLSFGATGIKKKQDYHSFGERMVIF